MRLMEHLLVPVSSSLRTLKTLRMRSVSVATRGRADLDRKLKTDYDYSTPTSHVQWLRHARKHPRSSRGQVPQGFVQPWWIRWRWPWWIRRRSRRVRRRRFWEPRRIQCRWLRYHGSKSIWRVWQSCHGCGLWGYAFPEAWVRSSSAIDTNIRPEREFSPRLIQLLVIRADTRLFCLSPSSLGRPVTRIW